MRKLRGKNDWEMKKEKDKEKTKINENIKDIQQVPVS